MSKRKPPSQRPERKMDETASAIVRQREEDKAAKAAKPGRLVSDDLKSQADRARTSAGPLKPVGMSGAPSNRRQKMGGG